MRITQHSDDEKQRLKQDIDATRAIDGFLLAARAIEEILSAEEDYETDDREQLIQEFSAAADATRDALRRYSNIDALFVALNSDKEYSETNAEQDSAAQLIRSLTALLKERE